MHKEGSGLVLYSLKKSAKARNNLILYEDITLELCGELKINNNYSELFNQINECIILEKTGDFSSLKSNSLDSFDDIVNSINSILINNSISFKKAKTLINIILFYCEFYSHNKKYENVISLCTINESLCFNIGNKKALNSTWNYLGIAHIKLNNIDSSISVFKKYFDNLINEGNEKEDFIFPIGYNKCCQLKMIINYIMN